MRFAVTVNAHPFPAGLCHRCAISSVEFWTGLAQTVDLQAKGD